MWDSHFTWTQENLWNIIYILFESIYNSGDYINFVPRIWSHSPYCIMLLLDGSFDRSGRFYVYLFHSVGTTGTHSHLFRERASSRESIQCRSQNSRNLSDVHSLPPQPRSYCNRDFKQKFTQNELQAIMNMIHRSPDRVMIQSRQKLTN